VVITRLVTIMHAIWATGGSNDSSGNDCIRLTFY